MDTLTERISATSDCDFIVCGWFTPDYRYWWDRLQRNLDDIGAPHDFVEVQKSERGWEANTMRKPHEVLAAMHRHPDTIIIFLDVDCLVTGGLAGLCELANIRGDIGVFLRTKWKPHGSPWIGIRSGTMVLRPTPAARAFVECWCEASFSAPQYCTDQDSIRYALGGVPGLSVTFLDIRYCATPKDHCKEPVILHDGGKKPNQSNRLSKFIGRLAWMATTSVGR